MRKIEDVYIDFKNGQGPYISDIQLNQLQKLIKQEILQKLQLTFPVGSTYITQQNTNPNTILGFGTWERLKGKVAVGLDEDDADGYFNEIGKEGGEKKHKQTAAEVGPHNHTYSRDPLFYGESASAPGTSLGELRNNANGQFVTATTESAGEGQPMNITQPYRVVGYMWIRTA